MITIVIPTLNEEENLRLLLEHLKMESMNYKAQEIIVADGGSSDKSEQVCIDFKVKFISCPKAQRASQMNYGSEHGSGEILYFLHADSFPPNGFEKKIRSAVEKGAIAGCFTMKFDDKNPILSIYSWFTRFRLNIFRGGDQSLFVQRIDFKKLGGYNEEMSLMEDYEMIKRLCESGKFEIIHNPITTSSRKYGVNGVLRLQVIYFVIQMMYRMGFSQEKLIEYYKKMVRR